MTAKYGVSFGGDENAPKLNSGDGYTTLYEKSLNCALKQVNFMSCKLILLKLLGKLMFLKMTVIYQKNSLKIFVYFSKEG